MKQQKSENDSSRGKSETKVKGRENIFNKIREDIFCNIKNVTCKRILYSNKIDHKWKLTWHLIIKILNQQTKDRT